MAAELFYVPAPVAFTSNGLPAAGAKAYFYATGTLTPQDVYTTAALSTVHANPVVANGAGRLPTIYLNDAIVHRLIIKDALNVTLVDIDPYLPETAGGAVGIAGFGAVGDGVTNDSAAFTTAITAIGQPTLGAGKSYSIKDVVLGNSQSISGEGQIFSAATGATNVLILQNYNPRATGLYISTSLNATQGAFRIRQSRYALISDVTVINAGPGFVKIVPENTTTQAVALPILHNLDAEDVTGIGVDIGSSVSEIRATNLHIYGKLTPGTGGNRPMFTTTGWKQNTPVVGGNAVGGHQVVNANMITTNRGFHLTDAQLSKYSNCIADSCSDYGVLVDGVSDKVEFSNLFVGATRGIKVSASSQNISFKGLETVLNGTIPPWGSTDFYNGIATFYDLEVRDTAKVYVKGWTGSKRIIVDSGARLVVDDGENYQGRSVGTVAAATTIYLAEWGQSATEEDCVWRAPYDGYLIRICPAVSVAPGGAQTFTYTARNAAVDTTLIGTITGAAFGGVDFWASTLIPVNKGAQITIKLVTGATAAASRHNVILQFVPR